MANNDDFVSEEFLQLIIAQTALDTSSKKPNKMKDCGMYFEDHSSMCFYLCLYQSIKDHVDGFIQNPLDIKKLVFGLDDFINNSNLKGQKVKPDEIRTICEILAIQVHVYSPNGNDPYFCDKYGSTGNIVNMWLADGHYQIILEF